MGGGRTVSSGSTDADIWACQSAPATVTTPLATVDQQPPTPVSDMTPAVPSGQGSPATHSPVVLFVHQVVPGPEGHQVSVVRWRRDGHGARTAHVGVTQLVGENLQLIGRETIVIPKHVIVGRPACSLKADQRVKEESGAHLRRALLRKGQRKGQPTTNRLLCIIINRHLNRASCHPMCEIQTLHTFISMYKKPQEKTL